ncbi:MAG: hypothetical protein Q9160_001495 [Pyrenula sp. 1 TL-2023]
MSTHDKILSAASENASLLAALAETDYAAPALHQQHAYIRDLKREISENDVQQQKLAGTTKTELKDHEKYRDSTVRRFAYRVGGKKEKFQEKASKEEKEYFDAVTAEFRAKQSRATLDANLKDAEKFRQELEGVVSQHDGYQKRLDELYNSIFSGPTPDLPQEDEKEQIVAQVKSEFDQAQSTLSVESQIISILHEANKAMKQALINMNQAESMSEFDMVGFGGSYADLAERNHLSIAQSQMSTVHMLVNSASRLSPAVHPLANVDVAQSNFMSDVLFDNIFSDYSFHKKIQASSQGMHREASNLAGQLQAAQQREEASRQSLDETKNRLEGARQSLQDTRMQAFQSI